MPFLAREPPVLQLCAEDIPSRLQFLLPKLHLADVGSLCGSGRFGLFDFDLYALGYLLAANQGIESEDGLPVRFPYQYSCGAAVGYSHRVSLAAGIVCKK